MNNFDSIEKLVEFGLGIGVAQQMIRMMNTSMQSMHIPGQMNPTQKKEWYLAENGKSHGPYDEKEIKTKLNNKEITKDTFVWSVGMPTWKTAEETPEFLKLLLQIPPTL